MEVLRDYLVSVSRYEFISTIPKRNYSTRGKLVIDPYSYFAGLGRNKVLIWQMQPSALIGVWNIVGR